MSQEREKTRERERERGCGESVFCIKEIEEIGRQPEAATVKDTHTNTHLRLICTLVSQHSFTRSKECFTLRPHTTVVVSHILGKKIISSVFYFYI